MADAQPEERKPPQPSAEAGAARAKPEQQERAQPQLSGYLAEVVDVNTHVKTGISGEIYSISCKILEGNDKGRIIRRNVLGPIKIGDVVRLPDTSREAREIRVK
jgi:small subunit ribosomal protein S28e